MDAKRVLTVTTCVIALWFLTAEASPNPAFQYIRPAGTYHRVNPTNYHGRYYGNDGYFHYPGYGYNPVIQSVPAYGVPNSGFNGFGGFQNGFGYPGGYSSPDFGNGNGYGYYPPQSGFTKSGK